MKNLILTLFLFVSTAHATLIEDPFNVVSEVNEKISEPYFLAFRKDVVLRKHVEQCFGEFCQSYEHNIQLQRIQFDLTYLYIFTANDQVGALRQVSTRKWEKDFDESILMFTLNELKTSHKNIKVISWETVSCEINSDLIDDECIKVELKLIGKDEEFYYRNLYFSNHHWGLRKLIRMETMIDRHPSFMQVSKYL